MPCGGCALPLLRNAWRASAVTEDHDSKIADLYRQCSQETPAAHVDRAVMEMARRSVRRRGLSPFGNHWIAGGAMLGVVMLSVLLIVTMPRQPETHAPAQDAISPSAEVLSGARKGPARPDAWPSEPPPAAVERQQAPAAPKARFQVYEELQDMEVTKPDAETRAHMKQAPAEAGGNSAGSTVTAPAGARYLYIGSFREQRPAVELSNRLTELGFKCEVQAVSIADTGFYHRVRIGPFSNPAALDKSRHQLGELGIETRTLKDLEL